jgi:uncharacterized membrane protein YqjE
MALSRDSRRSIGTLIRDLADGSATLVRQEVYLARLEFTRIAQSVGTGTAFVATGSVFALLGALTLFIGIILLPGDQWLRDRYWLAALIVMLLTGAFAAWFARRGMTYLTPQQLTPDQTLATLKEDKEWLRQQLK